LPDLRLRPLRNEELPEYLAATQRDYERGLIVDARVAPAEAQAKAERDTAALLPNGLATEGHHLYAVENADGERVGSLHYAEQPSASGTAWLFYIFIEDRFRGVGLGRAAMRLFEEDARAQGFRRAGLNVWGGNDRARGLYRSLAYRDVSVHMAKDLHGD